MADTILIREKFLKQDTSSKVLSDFRNSSSSKGVGRSDEMSPDCNLRICLLYINCYIQQLFVTCFKFKANNIMNIQVPVTKSRT